MHMLCVCMWMWYLQTTNSLIRVLELRANSHAGSGRRQERGYHSGGGSKEAGARYIAERNGARDVKRGPDRRNRTGGGVRQQKLFQRSGMKPVKKSKSSRESVGCVGFAPLVETRRVICTGTLFTMHCWCGGKYRYAECGLVCLTHSASF